MTEPTSARDDRRTRANTVADAMQMLKDSAAGEAAVLFEMTATLVTGVLVLIAKEGHEQEVVDEFAKEVARCLLSYRSFQAKLNAMCNEAGLTAAVAREPKND